ncbi:MULTISPECIES: cytochrome P450 [unclassified Streptomyces]|uniref:cytochrome P450 n=1 Tax=unclassified Streptomyces TaxID=2593676 RepID=UPI000DBAAEA0|nr:MULTISPECIES: cytochrome P450 [unclassified Streptomyces]MYT69147.1 cytochrome P450 [Streptomyces sp. SID8367]RAJ82659.1 cytochrome P450 [Streptomyces sp. PsTaAH-137]
MSSQPTSDIDLFADEVVIDPYPAFAELRDIGPVVRLPKNDVYALTRYDTIRAALGDWESFSSASIAFNARANEALAGTSLASDPPVHTRLRATLTENLSPRALRGLKGRIEAKADGLVAGLVERGSFEAVDALARVFPLEVVADLIGFTGRARANMLRWGQAAMEVIGPMNQRTADSFPIAGELYAWCSEVRAGDLAEGSVGRGIFDAEERGAVPPGSAGHIIHQYLGAGIDTTVAAIGNIVALFAAHPDQLALVRDRPSLLPGAFNEVLRYWSPVNVWGRRAARDVEIDGVIVPAGAQIAVLLGAGNRDPRHYADPDTFRVERSPVDHLSFGYGPHGCAGQGLARLEAHAVIGALARRVERLVVGAAVRVPGNITRSIASLPVLEVTPA